MNLIEKFENMPVQDVGTFNSIFTATPIMGFSFETKVQIKDLVAGRRRIVVGDQELFIELSQKTRKVPEQKKKSVTKKTGTQYKKVNKKELSLSPIYKMLKPTEFMIYSAIKQVTEIHGFEEFSRQIGLSNKTVAANIKRLVELKLVKCEYVVSVDGSFNKITIDTDNLNRYTN